MSDFHAELDSFEIQVPGGGKIPFRDDDAVLSQMQSHYGNWRERGKVTSIPLARIPRLFFGDESMPDYFRQRFQALQKGEEGEIKIFKELLGLANLGGSGILVYPNVDGNGFRHLDAQVEIDFVVLVADKGAFLVNVKKARVVDEKKIADDMRRHSRFVHLVATYRESAEVPIYGVVCTLENRMNAKKIEDRSGEGIRGCHVFQPTDFEDFPHKWAEMASKLPDIAADGEQEKAVDTLASRLFVLNIMDGSLAQIHERIATDDFQRQRKAPKVFKEFTEEMVKEALKDDSADEARTEEMTKDLKDLNIGEVGATKVNKKKSIMLWSKQQLGIITKIMKVLRQGGNQGCRLVIKGPKGSGKTMILTYIARWAAQLFEADKPNQVVVADGRQGSSIIFLEKLKKTFENTKVGVVDDENQKGMIKHCRLLMYDECIVPNFEILIEPKRQTHLILFTSRNDFPSEGLEVFTLQETLRATVEITRFVEKFRKIPPFFHEVPLNPGHNLVSSAPTVDIVYTDCDSDAKHDVFVDKAVNATLELIKAGRGLKEILLAPYTHSFTLKKILDRLDEERVDYEFRNPTEKLSKFKNFKDEKAENLLVIVCTGNHVDGAEFGAVLILIDSTLPLWWEQFLHGSVFISMTRSTTLLRIIYNYAVKAPQINYFGEKTVKHGMSFLEVFQTKEIKRDEFESVLVDIVFGVQSKVGPVLIIGDMISKSLTPADPPNLYKSNILFDWWSLPRTSKLIVSFKNFDHKAHIGSLLITSLQSLNSLSAVIISTFTDTAFEVCMKTMNRHSLLYSFIENQINQVPCCWLYSKDEFENYFYVKSSLELCFDSMKNFFLTYGENSKSKTIRLDHDEKKQSETWLGLKKSGNILFDENSFRDAIEKYKKSLKLIKIQYAERIFDMTLEEVCSQKREIAKLCTNLSLTSFKIFSISKDFNFLYLSLQYAQRSIDEDPTWNKGHVRAKIAMEGLHMDSSEIERSINKNTSLSLRDKAIEDRIKLSSSFQMIRKDGPIFLVDPKGGGNYKHMSEALQANHPKFSLIVKPGTYTFKHSVLIENRSIDVIGDLDTKLDNLKSSPIIFKNELNTVGTSILMLHFADIKFVRITLSEHKHVHGSHCVSAINSKLQMIECSFFSKCSPAISVCESSELIMSECVSCEAYHPILVDGAKAFAKITDCFFSKSIVQAIEVRNLGEVDLTNCQIINNGGVGLASSFAKNVKVSGCLFEGNGNTKSVNEGSLQLRGSPAVIHNTIVRNQKGFGIVIEGGSGDFKELKISHCQSGGMLVQAPLHLEDNIISKTRFGLVICGDIPGEVIMKNNRISDCTCQIIGQHQTSQKPRMIGNSQHEYRTLSDLFGFSQKQMDSMFKSQTQSMFHPNQKRSVDPVAAAYGLKAGMNDDFDRVIDNCQGCSLPNYNNTHFPCPDCEVEYYCSVKCMKKCKAVHEFHCLNYQRLKVMKESQSGN